MLAGASSRPRSKSADSPAPSRSVRPTGAMLAAATLPSTPSAALAGRRAWPEPNLIHRVPRNTAPDVGEVASAGYDQAGSGCRQGKACEAVACAANTCAGNACEANTPIGGVRATGTRADGMWRPGSCGMSAPEATEMAPVVFARPRTTVPAEAWQAPRESIASAPGPIHSEMARPQPVEQAREIILEWSKSGIVVDDAPTTGRGLLR